MCAWMSTIHFICGISHQRSGSTFSRDGFDNVASLFLFLLLSSTPAHPAISQTNRTYLLNLLAFLFLPFSHHALYIRVIHPGVLQNQFCNIMLPKLRSEVKSYLTWSHQRVLEKVTSIFRALQPFSCCSLDRIPSSALQRPVNTACIDHFSETDDTQGTHKISTERIAVLDGTKTTFCRYSFGQGSFSENTPPHRDR